MSICVYAFGVQVGEILQQGVEDVSCLIRSAGDEAAEERDVVIGDMSVGDSPGLAIANMVLGQQVVFVSLKVGTIGRGGIPSASLPWQFKPGIQINEIRGGRA